MPNSKTFRRFLFKNAYLLLIAAWLVTLSFIVDNYWSANSSIHSVQSKISTYIHKQEKDLKKLSKDTAAIEQIIQGTYTEDYLAQPLPIRDQVAYVPTTPGLGVTIDEDKVRRFSQVLQY